VGDIEKNGKKERQGLKSKDMTCGERGETEKDGKKEREDLKEMESKRHMEKQGR